MTEVNKNHKEDILNASRFQNIAKNLLLAQDIDINPNKLVQLLSTAISINRSLSQNSKNNSTSSSFTTTANTANDTKINTIKSELNTLSKEISKRLISVNIIHNQQKELKQSQLLESITKNNYNNENEKKIHSYIDIDDGDNENRLNLNTTIDSFNNDSKSHRNNVNHSKPTLNASVKKFNEANTNINTNTSPVSIGKMTTSLSSSSKSGEKRVE